MALSTAVDLSAVARVVGIKTEFVNLLGGSVVNLPQRIVVLAQGNSDSVYATDKLQVTSATQAAEAYGYGSPAHLAVAQLFPSNGDGVGTLPVTVYPLEADASAVAAAASITPVGTATAAGAAYVLVNDITSAAFVIAKGDTVAEVTAKMEAAVNSVIGIPMTAVDGTTELTLTAKWKGESGNMLNVSISGGDDTGITFVTVQPTGGLVNPDVDTALAKLGNVWETCVINCLNISDTDTLEKLATVGEGRWGALNRKPFVAFTGTVATTPTEAIIIPEQYKTVRINSQIVAPGSTELPFVICARAVGRIAVLANNNPPHDYARQTLDDIEPGADDVQWNYIEKNQAVAGGSSTTDVTDGVINLSDTVTFYHPTGDVTPAYRYVVDIMKVMNILFNLDLRFATAAWDGAPLVPDDQVITNKTAKKPRDAVAAVSSLIDSLSEAAIISDPDYAKAATAAAINSTNPKRLDVTTTMKISGNTNIISVDFNWGFYFG